ncbi:serine/threonine-protein kinase [Polyangium sp. y55x31]|uniref:serine/threonine-protein kinase n=1 Tax=Polyangium sp. y55x31 TaxID=3042688 RepID=UPI002482CC35|nr:serine/threonine-protein kinase [Polyangium sp. y55x31]MDI1480398.1 AAA family ATPase [Polyangium sp. y55x31]
MSGTRRADPLPETFGPYQVLEKLGSGGMGVVYRARHRETGTIVAVKTVNLPQASPERDAYLLASILREIRALRRVKHPGIVPIVDDGEVHGVPWMAMEFLEGRTLAVHIRDLWPASPPVDPRIAHATTKTAPPLDQPSNRMATPAASPQPRHALGPILTLIRRLCVPLAHLHGAGLVHRDLKPENIVLLEGDRPVLIDLGIAVPSGGATGREELDIESPYGTPPYMAPEQQLGKLVDARADLYALGCILYECVTGRRPVNVGGIPPSAFVPGLPPELTALILGLLERNPEDRIGYAADVAQRLIAIGAEDEPDEGPPAPPYLYRPKFEGRAQVLADLRLAVARTAHERRGGIRIVHGESGVGKTRLAKEIVQDTIRRGSELAPRICVIPGQCIVASENRAIVAGAPPLHPLRPVLRAAAARAYCSREEAERLFGHRGRILELYEPALCNLPGRDTQPAPAPLPPGNARSRVIAAMRDVLWALAEESPLLLVLDDLQWADELTMRLLATLARARMEERGVLVIGTYRSEEKTLALDSLVHEESVETLGLGRLDDRSVKEIVAGMLAQKTPPGAVLEVLARVAQGNPFFVSQYLHAALEEKILKRDTRSGFCFDADGVLALTSLPLPDTLVDLIGRRLDRLDAAGQALVAWAAVLGQELDDEFLLSLPGSTHEEAGEALEALRVRRILEVTTDGALAFTHDKLREIAYARIASSTRARLHLRASEALEVQYAAMPEKAVLIAQHLAEASRRDEAGRYFIQGGAQLREKAGRYFQKAAEYARKVYANSEAIGFYQAAIDALRGTRMDIAGLYEEKGDLLALAGRYADAREAYRAALSEVRRMSVLDRARRLRKIGKTWEMHHAHAQALDHYAKAQAALGKPPSKPRSSSAMAAWSHEWIQIQFEQISVCYWQADIDNMSRLIERLEPEVKRLGTPLHQAHYLHALTQRNIQTERFVASAETVAWARECVAAYEIAGEPRTGHLALGARCSLAILLWLHGALDESDMELNAALQIAEKTGNFEIQVRCLSYLAVVHRGRRLIAQAEEVAKRSLSLAETEQIREYVGVALGNLAWVAFSRGNLVETERLAGEAIARWSPPHVFPFQWLARLPLCAVKFARKDLAGAINEARSVLDSRQQCLPEPIGPLLREAVEAYDKRQKVHARDTLSRALESAVQIGYA